MNEQNRPQRLSVSELTGGEYVGSDTLAELLGVSHGQLRMLIHERQRGGRADKNGAIEGPDGVRRRPLSKAAALLPQPHAELQEKIVWKRAEVDAIVDEFKKAARTRRA